MNQIPIIVIDMISARRAVNWENLFETCQIIIFLIVCQFIALMKTDDLGDGQILILITEGRKQIHQKICIWLNQQADLGITFTCLQKQDMKQQVVNFILS